MEHRHLLSDEFDLLVDGEEGFGVAPLAAHVEACASCRAEVESRRRLVASLERLPHLAPSPLFAYHVMRDVPVFEPWYVPAIDIARRLLPRSRPARVLAGTTAAVMASTLTLAAVWLIARLDVVAFLLGAAGERLRASLVEGAGSLVSSAIGAGVFGVVRGGGPAGIGVAIAGFFFTVLLAAISLRALATASHRRRS